MPRKRGGKKGSRSERRAAHAAVGPATRETPPGERRKRYRYGDRHVLETVRDAAGERLVGIEEADLIPGGMKKAPAWLRREARINGVGDALTPGDLEELERRRTGAQGEAQRKAEARDLPEPTGPILEPDDEDLLAREYDVVSSEEAYGGR